MKTNQNVVMYDKLSDFGNCEEYGLFVNQKYNPLSSRNYECQPNQAVRSSSLAYHCQVPMDAILRGLTALQSNGRVYNPRAFYVPYRRFWVDWMFSQSEKMNF